MSRAAHPRSRGENAQAAHQGFRPAGSSPLTRGKHGRGAGGGRVRRLIPAHAGKTPSTASSSTSQPAHPRSRGENRRLVRVRRRPDGSSPLTRGKRIPPASGSKAVRLIPAHAGKTRRDYRTTGGQEAHPRSRGENQVRSVDEESRTGSSPLTRGKHVATATRSARPRLIPAHAGKTWRNLPASRRDQAHPRSRGENTSSIQLRIPVGGSSPLTRGKRSPSGTRSSRSRLIPAHAGKTRHP